MLLEREDKIFYLHYFEQAERELTLGCKYQIILPIAWTAIFKRAHEAIKNDYFTLEELKTQYPHLFYRLKEE